MKAMLRTIMLVALLLGLGLTACNKTATQNPNPNPNPSPNPNPNAPKENHLPVARFDSQSERLSIRFDASASSDDDGSIQDYRWDYGDGKTGAGKISTHVYQAAGAFDITLSVTDNQGGVSSSVQTLTVANSTNQAPKAAFSAESALLSVKLDAALASDSDGTITSYAWDLGEGLKSSDKIAFRTFDAAGDYPISLSVTDDKGSLNTVTQDVTVGAKGTISGTLSIEGLPKEGDVLEGGGMLISAFIPPLTQGVVTRLRSGSQFSSKVFTNYSFEVEVGEQSLFAWIDVDLNDCRGVSEGDYFGQLESAALVKANSLVENVNLTLMPVNSACPDNDSTNTNAVKLMREELERLK